MVNLTEQLEGYEKSGQLARHAAPIPEIKQHIDTASKWLTDAQRSQNSLETRFSVANSAGHGLLMAAIKMKGFRPTGERGHRQILYQLLDALLPAATHSKKTLSDAHKARNRAEYDGDDLEVTQGQVDDVIDAVKSVKEEVDYLFNAYKKALSSSTEQGR